ncbi:hypothetical protein OJAV_G00125090 [Oryzias javanicus]|uniref:CD3 gamma/delta subunit Ig-like domain-containing protein n=1 Tax=Oryzias javanicus TaxID=123683 RepID=A0A3S2MQC9_ORYJA|nr:hypothetical protein OJAV_G00125090 [Oryzias javanicus]
MTGVQSTFVVLLLCAVTLEAQGDSKGGVQFNQNKVTLTCPSDSSNWGPKLSNTGGTYEFTYQKPVEHYCIYSDQKYFFYVKGKGCENCFELEGWLLGAAIIGDVVVTTILMTIIYKCTKKKTGDQPAQTIAPSAPPLNYPQGHRGRHVPSNQTYEKLNHQTRSPDVYSSVHKTG